MKAWLLIAVLFVILAASIVGAVVMWTQFSDVEMSVHGYIAMTLGIVFTVGLGAGLMALTFFSAKRGYDEIDIRED